MADQISFEIVTPDGLKFQADVYEVQVPTPKGYIGVLTHHMDLITIVVPGVILIRRHKESEELEPFATAGGFIEIDGKRARLLADSAERAEDIDALLAEEALAKARELKRNAKDHVTFTEAVALMEQHLARLKVAGLKQRPKQPR